MFRFLILIVVSLLLSAGAPAASEAEIYLSIESAPRTIFPDADSVERKDIQVDDNFRDRMQALIGRDEPSIWEPFYISFIARKSGQVIGYAVICEEIGKHDPITFIVGTGTGGKVKDVAIMMYREARGGEVRYPGFVKQFRDKNLDNPVKHRRDIRNVTGATMSSRAMAVGVRKALAFLQLTYLQ
jgi:Na+-translocating ferredoxin:NAD+ oxidoreductase RnfG subunit